MAVLLLLVAVRRIRLTGVAIGLAACAGWASIGRLRASDVAVFALLLPAAGVLDFTRPPDRGGAGFALLFISIGGVYATVPDTEAARVLLGLTAPLALGWPLALRLGAGGRLVACGLIVRVAVVDGAPRPAAVVGAIGCIGLLALEPLLPRPRNAAVVVTTHAFFVLVASRVAGRMASASRAIAVLAAATALLALVPALRPSPRSSPDGPRRRRRTRR